MHFLRTKLENVKLREDLVRQNKKLEEMFEVLQKQIQNLARNLDKQVSEEIQFEALWAYYTHNAKCVKINSGPPESSHQQHQFD